MSENRWVATQKSPLFTAALGLDSAPDKAAAADAALRAGTDPNELDHDFGKIRNRGRALAFFVNMDLHHEVNGSLDGVVNNLPAIEVMLRHGADPRLGAPLFGPPGALRCVVSARRRSCAPEFFEAAWRMLDEVAETLEGEWRRLESGYQSGSFS